MTEFIVLRKLEYVELPFFFFNFLGIYEIFNVTNSKYLDCQI